MPQAQTVDTPHRLPLVIQPDNRDWTTNKDSRLINCYVEKTVEGDYQLYKRPGVATQSVVAANSLGAGLVTWGTDVYSIFGTTFFKNGTSIGTVDGTNGVYRFGLNNTGATTMLQLGNGVKAYNYDPTHGLVAITDVNYPSATCKGFTYLDGTTYVCDTSNGLRGSNIGDTTTWSALNKILVQIEPDNNVAIAKQLVYVVVFKQWTTEFFYDAGNATASPLSPVQGAKVNYGCQSADSVQEIDGVLFWISSTKGQAPQVMKIDSLKPEIVSTKPIDRLLEKSDFTKVYSLQVKLNGHSFYVITFPKSNLTLAYDIKESLWSQWTDLNGNYFPFVAATGVQGNTYQRLLQHETNGKLYNMSDTVYTDDGSIIPVEVYTPLFDGGTKRRKVLSRLEFITDQTVGSTLYIQRTDDDYKTWSTWRTVDLGSNRPALNNCGTFRRRAYHLKHTSPTPLRLKAVEMQIDIGTT